MNSNQFLLQENEALKQLLSYGKIFVNYYSSDCDGGHSVGSSTFKSLEEFYKWIENQAEWADGPGGFQIVQPHELQESITWFTR